MDAKAELNKIWKDVRESAKEFAGYGLQVSSKALDFTAGRLKNLQENLKKSAEKLSTKPEGEAEKPVEQSK